MKRPIPSLLTSGVLAATFFLIAFSVLLGAQQSPSPTIEARDAALKKLAYFVGSWTMNGHVKLPQVLGPPREITLHQHCEWLTPESFVVCHGDSAGAGRSTSGLLILGYNPNDKAYTYDEYNSSGAAEHLTGTFEGDTWTWTSDEKTFAGQVTKTLRFGILSPTSYSFKYEEFSRELNWGIAMEGKAIKGQ